MATVEATEKMHSSFSVLKTARLVCSTSVGAGLQEPSKSPSISFTLLPLVGGASHSLCSDDSSRTSAFPCIVIGATKPKGSYRLLTVDNTPHRVNGFSSPDTQ